MCSRTHATTRSKTIAAAHRRGFTLVEVLLAVILINVGLLALVAESGVLLRQTNEVRARRNALQAGTNRLELLGAGSCVAATGATSGPLGVHEQWSVDVIYTGVRELRDSVTFPVRNEWRSFVLRTRLPC